MKFLAAALHALFLAVEARKVLRVEDLSGISRKLEGYNSITGDNSIQFNKCVSLTTEPADNDVFYSEENLSYAQRGVIVSAKSYVMFNVCQTDYCEEGGSDNLYMVDLNTYLSSTVGYFPYRREYYCQACEYSQKYCKNRKNWNDQQTETYFDYQKQQDYQWAQQEQQYNQAQNYYQQGNAQQYNQAQNYYQQGNAQQYNQAQNYYQGQDAQQWSEEQAAQQQYSQGQYQGGQAAGQYAAVESQQDGSYTSWMQSGKNWAGKQWQEVKSWWDGDQDQTAQQQYNQGQYQGGQAAGQYAAVESQQDESYTSWMQSGKNWAEEQWYDVRSWWGGDRRSLQNYGYNNYNREPQNVETVTCNTCEQYGCFDDDYYERGNGYYNDGNTYYNTYQYNEYQQQQQQQQQQQEDDIDYEEVYDWVTQMSECMEIEGQNSLYAGFICNYDGSGIEIGVFLDEECTIYNGMISYKSLILGYDNSYYNQAQQYQAQQQGGGNNYQESNGIAFLEATNDIVTYPFTHDINCADQMTYATPWGSYKQSGYYYDNQSSASQYCKAMFQGNSVKMQDCDEDVRDNYQYQQSQYQYYDQQDDEYGAYGFYKYDLSQNDLYNQVTVCQKIKSYNGKYPHVYYGGSNVFNYNNEDSGLSYVKKVWNEKDRFIERTFEAVFEGEFRGLKIFGFLTGSIFIAFLCLCMLKDCCWYKCCDSDEGAEEQPMATKLVPSESYSDGETAFTDPEDKTENGEVNVGNLYMGDRSEIDDFYTRVDD